MKTHRCWEQVVDPLNMWRGWLEFRRGKRGRPRVAAFAREAPSHVVRLAAELQDAEGGSRPAAAS